MPPLSRSWRSLRELERDPQFLAQAAAEFPSLAPALASPIERRRVLQLMAASLAMAGLGGCDIGAPAGVLTPPVRLPPGIVPGQENFYATLHRLDAYATGILVRHAMGRPIKVEGNPRHPGSDGATDVLAQAELLAFYDPDRAAALTFDRGPADWVALHAALAQLRSRLQRERGAGVRILTGTTSSPTVLAQMRDLARRYPELRWHQWDPLSRQAVREGAALAYGSPVEVIAQPERADVLVAIDSDLLDSAPGAVPLARDVARRRDPAHPAGMSRIYAIEPAPTLVGAIADHRFVVGPGELAEVLRGLASELLDGRTAEQAPAWLRAICADLRAHPGAALIHLGPAHPPAWHALVHALNERLGASGSTRRILPPFTSAAGAPGHSLDALVRDMRDGAVQGLLVLDCNPVYAAPGSLGFADALRRVPWSLQLALAPDETSQAMNWFVPMKHDWESWGDARAFDGTAAIAQPQSLPLHDGLSLHELLGLLVADQGPSDYERVRSTWQDQFGASFEPGWQEALAAGVIEGSAPGPLRPAVQDLEASRAALERSPRGLALWLRPDPYLRDGRHANNAWLQELPRPLSKLTWDNPLLIAPARAARLGCHNGDLVRLSVGGTQLTLPVWIAPGQHPDCIVALRGFGRRTGSIARGVGYDVHPLDGDITEPTLEKVAGHLELACTDHHQMLLDVADALIRHGTLARYRRDPQRLVQPEAPQPQLYGASPPGPARWAMSIDLNSCTGCSACVVACQAENNVPVVGREQVLAQREMHWLRIDRYWSGPVEEPATFFQPMLCQHCEQAPCEPVCPVGATVHDAEGLNVMVYNRCIGTRFCSNNCPYKVRRFNFLHFAALETRSPQARNPDVTVRARGVMEKCTFCLQRIAAARITADRSGTPIVAPRTACEAACPTRAIVFGDLSDPHSPVSRRKSSPRSYTVLEDQGTRPRVSYLAALRNPNPDLDGHA